MQADYKACLGWVALQEKEGIKKFVECGSATIADTVKRNFSVSELELNAVLTSLKKMRLLKIGNPNVIIRTDHLPLLGILKKPLDKIETRRVMTDENGGKIAILFVQN